jgi:restriction endonuclease EcoRII-like protein
MYTPNRPRRGHNAEHTVNILWQNGTITQSRVKWYGVGTRSEYRLTRFGRDFPFLAADTVGDLLVLVPKSHTEFIAYVLDLDEDIEEVQAALGVEPFERWGVYQHGAPQVEEEDECVQRNFRAFAQPLEDFPSGNTFSDAARRILVECVARFARLSPDDSLMKCMETEYELFRFVERQICQSEIARVFKDVDDFLQTAARVMNRRKARAGRSLENHVHHLLAQAGIPHEMRPPQIDGKPDVVIPSAAAYQDPDYPVKKLVIVGVKTTCKDRWRQVLNEGRKVRDKHILTIQPGISSNQLEEMHQSRVTLVVPQRLHNTYPADRHITLLDLAGFIQSVRARLA